MFAIICILITTFLGWNLLLLVSGKNRLSGLGGLECAGLSYLIGIAAVSVQMFAMGLLDIEFTRFYVFLPWLGVLCFNLFRRREAGKKVPVEAHERFRFSEIVLISFIALQTFYNFFRALIRPIESYDAVSIYGLKAKIMYLARGIAPDFFKGLASNFHGAHPDYPLLVPLSETWMYTFLNKFNDFAAKAIFPAMFLAFLLIFYAMLRRITGNRPFSLLFTFGLASVAQFSNYSTIAVADMALGIYFAASLFYLYLWMAEQKSIFLNISLLSAAACLWTKNEGLLLCLITVFMLAFYSITNAKALKKPRLAAAAVYILIVLLLATGWMFFKASQGLINENFDLSMVNLENLASGAGKIPAILYGYQRELFGVKKWNLSWIVFLFILVTQARHVFSGKIRYVTMAVVLFGLGYCAMYIFSAVEIKFFVRVTASRFLLHILPVALFWSALVIKERGLVEGV